MTLADRYIDLVCRSVTDLLHHEITAMDPNDPTDLYIVDRARREQGRDLPAYGETMIGLQRAQHLARSVGQILDQGIPGDLIEAGAWRGGAAIVMRAVLVARALDDQGDLRLASAQISHLRRVVIADSFRGMPANPNDLADPHAILAVPRTQVEAALDRYGLLDDRIEIVEGWFAETLPRLRGRPWALIRADADLASSTRAILNNLYPDLSPGGYLIVDDYGSWEPCRQAVDKFRNEHGITEAIERIDFNSICWRKHG